MASRATVLNPGVERGPCPYCQAIVTLRFDECGCDIESECTECGETVYSPADENPPRWYTKRQLDARD